MATHPDSGLAPSPTTAVSGPAAARRRPQSNAADRLEGLSNRLDELIRDVRLGATSHRQHELNVDEAEAIANELRSVFRSPSPGAAQHPPLWQRGGRAAW